MKRREYPVETCPLPPSGEGLDLPARCVTCLFRSLYGPLAAAHLFRSQELGESYKITPVVDMRREVSIHTQAANELARIEFTCETATSSEVAVRTIEDVPLPEPLILFDDVKAEPPIC